MSKLEDLRMQVKCAYCGGNTQAESVSFEHEHDGRMILVEHVPAEVCTSCGEKTYTPEVAEKLVRMAFSHLKPVRVIKVPVFDFAQRA